MNWNKVKDELKTYGFWEFLGIACLISLLIKYCNKLF